MGAAELEGYRSSVSRLAERAAEVAEGALAAYMAANPEAPVADVREYAKQVLAAVSSSLGTASAMLAAMMYDEVMERLGIPAQPASPHVAYSPEQVDAAARYQACKLVDGDARGFASGVGNTARSAVRRAANYTVEDNASRDSGLGVRYARVPSGAETCMFCIMVASRGFAYRSASSAGGDGHKYHAHCDCVAVPGRIGDDVEGYDPDELYRQWDESGFKPKQKKRKRSKSKYAAKGSGFQFSSFDDVRKWIYEAESMQELEHKHSVLGGAYGFRSDQMRSASVRNAFRHMEKILGEGGG